MPPAQGINWLTCASSPIKGLGLQHLANENHVLILVPAHVIFWSY